MESTLKFSKYSGNGNDFVITEHPLSTLDSEVIKRLCDRHFGVGADGVLVLYPFSGTDGAMKIFNADGGEAEMCANGLRCLVTYIDHKATHKKKTYSIKTMNSIYHVSKNEGSFSIEMSEIKDKNLYDFSTFHEFEKSFYVNTGVPHLVFLTKKVKEIDIHSVAPKYRSHNLLPNGSNVSLVGVDESHHQTAYVRTYERGVEDETLSCGTGLTATALALNFWNGWEGKINLHTLGGQQTVNISDKIHYSGEVKLCFHGEFPI